MNNDGTGLILGGNQYEFKPQFSDWMQIMAVYF
jgi:hypothetical protein